MTGIGIVISFLVFVIIALYLTKKYHQNFWKFFYWLPFFIVLTYFIGSYFNFLFEVGIFPSNGEELKLLLSPYGYKFHFLGIVIGMYVSISMFLKKIVRIENKKVRSDILFFSLGLSLVPLGIFMLMGDSFIGLPTSSWLGVKSLHSDSQRNKFTLVYPIGIMLSLLSLFVVMGIKIIKKKKFGYGMLGFAVLLVVLSIILMFQQYPRHLVVSFGSVMFDCKQYIARFVALLSYLFFRKRQKKSVLS